MMTYLLSAWTKCAVTNNNDCRTLTQKSVVQDTEVIIVKARDNDAADESLAIASSGHLPYPTWYNSLWHLAGLKRRTKPDQGWADTRSLIAVAEEQLQRTTALPDPQFLGT
jgi:hypothetical protein